MPDKPTQDWTDDAAFWDEAWMDMAARLDDKDRARGVAFWVRWLALPAVLLLGLLTFNLIGQEAEPNESRPPEAPVPAGAPAAVRDQNEGSTDSPATEVEQADHRKTEQPKVARVFDGEIHHPPTALSRPRRGQLLSTGAAAVEPSADRTIDAQTQEVVSGPGTNLPTPVEVSADLARTKQQRLAPTELTLLPSVKYTVDVPDFALQPKAIDLPSASRTEIGVEGDLTYASGGFSPGYRLGGYAKVGLGKRFYLPLSLVYERDRLRIATAIGTDLNSQDMAGGVPVSSDIRVTRIDGRRVNELRLDGLSLGTGLGYRLTPRLSMAVRADGVYRLAALGVTDLNQREEYRLTGIGSTFSGNEFNAAAPVAEQAIDFSESDLNTINRWQWRAGATVGYRLSPALNLRIGADRLLSPIFTRESIRVRPWRLAVGFRYQLR